MSNNKRPSFVPQEQMRSQTAPKTAAVVAQVTPVATPLTSSATGPVSDARSNLPILEVRNLPSQHLPYPDNAVVSYNPYTFGEIKKFAQSKFATKGRYEFIMNGVHASFDKKLLTFADFLFVALLRKLSSLGSSKFQLSFMCSKCGKKNDAVFALDDIEFKDLDLPKLPLVVDIGGVEMHFSPITIGGYLELVEKNLEGDEMSILAKQCVNLPYEKAHELIFTATPEEGEILEELDRMLFHTIAEKKIVCNNKEYKEYSEDGGEEKIVPCGHENRVEFDSPDVIIQPFRPDRESIKSRIHFGSKSAPQSA